MVVVLTASAGVCVSLKRETRHTTGVAGMAKAHLPHATLYISQVFNWHPRGPCGGWVATPVWRAVLPYRFGGLRWCGKAHSLASRTHYTTPHDPAAETSRAATAASPPPRHLRLRLHRHLSDRRTASWPASRRLSWREPRRPPPRSRSIPRRVTISVAEIG